MDAQVYGKGKVLCLIPHQHFGKNPFANIVRKGENLCKHTGVLHIYLLHNYQAWLSLIRRRFRIF